MTKRLLFDGDPGCDDVVALLMALGAENVDLTAVTTVAGNTSAGNATRNALSVLTYAGQTDVPVATGCDRALSGERVDAEHVHGSTGLPDFVQAALPNPAFEPDDRHAVDLIIDQTYEYGEDLTMAFVGPATNFAAALTKEPDLGDVVGDVYFLGGAIRRAGNVTPAASFNAWADPVACQRTFDATPKLVPLDVSEPAITPLETLDRFDEDGGLLGLVSSLLRDYTLEQVRRKWNRDGVIASDTAVLADVIGEVLEFERGYVAVNTDEGLSRGETIFDEHGKYDRKPNADVALEIDVDAYRDVFETTLRSVHRDVA